MRDPAGESLHYWDSLANPAETRFYVWIEPPGWRPIWGPENKYGKRFIENTPRLWFEFRTSTFMPKYPKWLIHKDAEPRVGPRDTLALEGQEFIVRWNPREPEAEAFGKEVYNILRKLTACAFKVFECDLRRAFRPETRRMQKMCLAGRHALAWSLKRRHNYLKCDHWACLLKPADYRFRPGDVFTKAEYKRYLADREAEFQAELKQRLEDDKREARARKEAGEPPSLAILIEGAGPLSGFKMRVPIGKSSPGNGK
jgi:hypothetical protein